MQRNDAENVTITDVIHGCIASGVGQTKALEIAREIGFHVRDIEFAALWREERERFTQWRRQQTGS